MPPDRASRRLGRSPLAARYSGREFALADNDAGLKSVRLDFADSGNILTIADERGAVAIPCGFDAWIRTDSRPLGAPIPVIGPVFPGHVAASGAWTGDSAYTVDLCWYRTPFRTTLGIEFDGDRVSITGTANVSFGPGEPARFEGRAI